MAAANTNATDIVTTATTNRDNEEFSLLPINADNDNDADTVNVVLVTGWIRIVQSRSIQGGWEAVVARVQSQSQRYDICHVLLRYVLFYLFDLLHCIGTLCPGGMRHWPQHPHSSATTKLQHNGNKVGVFKVCNMTRPFDHCSKFRVPTSDHGGLGHRTW